MSSILGFGRRIGEEEVMIEVIEWTPGAWGAGLPRAPAVYASVLAAGAGASSGAILRPASPRGKAHATLITKVSVTEKEYKITLNKKSAKRGIVIFKVTNVGKVQHTFEIRGRKTRLISPGKSTTLRVTFLRKGHYPYKCFVTGHAALGMKGVFTIT